MTAYIDYKNQNIVIPNLECIWVQGGSYESIALTYGIEEQHVRHKLIQKLVGRYSCKNAHELRIVLSFVHSTQKCESCTEWVRWHYHLK